MPVFEVKVDRPRVQSVTVEAADETQAEEIARYVGQAADAIAAGMQTVKAQKP